MPFLPDSTSDRFLLPEAERFVLWALRAWCGSKMQGRRPEDAMLPQLEKVGLPWAFAPLDAVCSAVATDARRSVRVHCPCTPHLSFDERLWLAAAAAAQQGDSAGARRLMKTWLPADRIVPAVHALESFMAQCVGRGYALGGGTEKPIPAQERTLPTAVPATRPVGVTLH